MTGKFGTLLFYYCVNTTIAHLQDKIYKLNQIEILNSV